MSRSLPCHITYSMECVHRQCIDFKREVFAVFAVILLGVTNQTSIIYSKYLTCQIF